MIDGQLKQQLGDSVRERLPSTSDRGQVGIGTLIVFIAMVLVAAIAAGVLINTAGFLQSTAEQTGDESQSQVTNRVHVVSQTGIVADSGNVGTVSLSVKRSSGADDIDLASTTVQWLGPDGESDLTYADVDPDSSTDFSGIADSEKDSKFTVTTIQDKETSNPILDEQGDLFKINLDASSISTGGLAEGDTVELKITTSSGATQIVHLRVPDSLSGDEAVSL